MALTIDRETVVELRRLCRVTAAELAWAIGISPGTYRDLENRRVAAPHWATPERVFSALRDLLDHRDRETQRMRYELGRRYAEYEKAQPDETRLGVAE